MKPSLLIPLVLFPGIAPAANISFGVVRTYDEDTVEPLKVDTNASGNILSSTDPNDVAGFTALVATAYDNNMGGVVNFDSQSTSTSTGNTGLTITYGVSKTLQINSTSNTGGDFYSSDFGGLGAISGANGLLPLGTSTSAWRLTFASITGASPAEIVTSAGFTVLSRDSSGQDLLVEWFTNGETVTATSSDTETITAGKNVDDTFFSYTAPSGSYISSFRLTYGGTGDKRLGIDDLGFITSPVPEPSSALLLLLAAVPLLRRRR